MTIRKPSTSQIAMCLTKHSQAKNLDNAGVVVVALLHLSKFPTLQWALATFTVQTLGNRSICI